MQNNNSGSTPTSRNGAKPSATPGSFARARENANRTAEAARTANATRTATSGRTATKQPVRSAGTTKPKNKKKKNKNSIWRKILKYLGRTLLVVLVTVIILLATAYIMIYKCCNGPSEAGKELFVTTILESGQMKFLASWVLSKEEIVAIQEKNAMPPMTTDIDTDLINIKGDDDDPDDTGAETGGDYVEKEVFDKNGVRIVEISGRTFFAKLMIVKDPSQVRVGSSYSNGWGEYGIELEKIVKNAGAIGGINGGLYESSGNKGGNPYGVVVQNGKIICNKPNSNSGLYLIGLTNDNILIIKDLKDIKSASAFESYCKEVGLRDAVCFQEESTDANNHFVPLVINGEGRELNGMGSGANPRTAIGQRADGAILMLVTDGRGAQSHLGATASDLIAIMLEYGAINAANLDGGSSSSMYYDGEYEMTSTTLYYQHSSWRLPDGFVVMPKN